MDEQEHATFQKEPLSEFALDNVSVDEIRNGSRPTDFTVYQEGLRNRMEEGKIKNDLRYTITLAYLWRIADAGNMEYFSGEEAENYLKTFYEFANKKENRDILDRVVGAMPMVWETELDEGWGLSNMSPEMEDFFIKYVDERLGELRGSEEKKKYQKFARSIVEIVKIQEAHAKVGETRASGEEEDIDDLMLTDWIGEYRLSENLVNGLMKVLTEEDFKVSSAEESERIEETREKFHEEFGNKQ